MTLFMDVHHNLPEGATAADVAAAHAEDVKIQDKYGVNYVSYWVDATRRQGVLPGRGAGRGQRARRASRRARPGRR
jgi:Nickel responsive protein SCO4226-like